MWFRKNYQTIIRLTYIIPILFAAGVSIAHVVTWYGMTNPLAWAIYLSIGIEVAALSALAGITAKMNKWVYFPFIIVTLIQFIGNVFFSFQFIDIKNPVFLAWVDLVNPLFDSIGMASTGDLLAHKRWLALFAGGLIPVISLSFLHLLISFNDKVDTKLEKIEPPKEPITPEDDLKQKMEEAQILGHSKDVSYWNIMGDNKEKRVFKIPVDPIPEDKMEEYIKQVVNKIKYEPPRGDMMNEEDFRREYYGDLHPGHIITPDLFLPPKSEEPVIESEPDIEDVEYEPVIIDPPISASTETQNEAILDPIIPEPTKDIPEVNIPHVSPNKNINRSYIERIGSNKIIKDGNTGHIFYKKNG